METIATRYSGALYSLALEKGEVVSYQEAAKSVLRLIEDNPEFVKVVSSAFLSKEERIAKVDLAFKGLPDDVRTFLKVIVRNGRFEEIESILREFNSECNDFRNIGEGYLYSVSPLSKDEIARIELAIGKKEKRTIELHNRLDPGLLGGVKAVIGDRVYDGSLLARLESLQRNLLKGGRPKHENQR